MKISEAADFISKAVTYVQQPSIWCDLGCGSGTFTYALATLLPPESTIYAVDKSFQSLKKSAGNYVKIDFSKADFEDGISTVMRLDGILMANSLHYIADKEGLIRRLRTNLSADGIFIIVEYETTSANPWVPYPINYTSLNQLFFSAGFKSVKKLGEKKSIYGPEKMYCCVVKS